MTDKQRMYCLSETSKYTDKDAYVSDLALSPMWGDAEDSGISPERIDMLGNLWDASRRSIKDICAAAGLSQRKFAEKFCIPYRTVENWCVGVRECPIYVRLMMQQLLGLL